MHQKEYELKVCRKYQKFSIECFRKIEIKSLDTQQLQEFFRILEDIGENLSFLVFSEYRFRYLSQISDESANYKLMMRGRYDAIIAIECANALMFFERRDRDDVFRVMKIDPTNRENVTPSDTFYANLDYSGLTQIPSNKLGDQKYDKGQELKFAFKAIRAPIIGRTFIIGGKENKAIRQITVGEAGKPFIKGVYCKYTVDVIKEFDLFYRTSTLFR